MARDSAALLARWEAMQNAYVPHRVSRFELMLDLAAFPQDREARVLDLGCGPGSLSLRVLGRYPHAQVLAVDAEPVLLELGRAAASACVERIRFLQADLREGGWWAEQEGRFDLVVSATALHWLSAEHLTQVYRRIVRALKPGGCFLNSDHFASDHVETRARYRAWLRSWQQAAFHESGAEDWKPLLARRVRGVGARRAARVPRRGLDLGGERRWPAAVLAHRDAWRVWL